MPALEVADIFRRHGESYRRTHAGHLSRTERRVMGVIEACRTVALGGHVERCAECGRCPRCTIFAARGAVSRRRTRQCRFGKAISRDGSAPADLRATFSLPAPAFYSP